MGAWSEALMKAPRVEVPAASLRNYTGVWRNIERGEVRRTRLAGDTLYQDGATRTVYLPLGEGRFRTVQGSEIRFEGDAGAISRLVVRSTGGAVTYTRADTVALDAAKLAEYAGDYRNDEVDVTHTWKVEKGKLVIYAGYRPLGAVEPTYKDGFTRGGTVVDMVRDAKGRITGYTLESGRVRRLRFTRVR